MSRWTGVRCRTGAVTAVMTKLHQSRNIQGSIGLTLHLVRQMQPYPTQIDDTKQHRDGMVLEAVCTARAMEKGTWAWSLAKRPSRPPCCSWGTLAFRWAARAAAAGKSGEGDPDPFLMLPGDSPVTTWRHASQTSRAANQACCVTALVAGNSLCEPLAATVWKQGILCSLM